MSSRFHNPWLLLLLLVVVFCGVGVLLSSPEMPPLVKALVVAITVGGWSVCLVEMADYFFFGAEQDR